MHINQFAESSDLNQQMVQHLIEVLNTAIKERGRAYLVVSGGSTPREMFKVLAETPLEWQKVTITLTDERCINPSEPDSNEYLVRSVLLKSKAASAEFISLATNLGNDYQVIENIESKIAQLPMFDAVILGMGNDGHTASLFPCSKEIQSGQAETEKALFTVRPVTAPYTRVTLSKKRLMQGRNFFLHLLGEKILNVLSEALGGDNQMEMPIRAFLHHQDIKLQIYYAP